MKRSISLAAFVAVVVALVLWLVLRERRSEFGSRGAEERVVHTAGESLDLVAEDSARVLEPAIAGDVEAAAPPLVPVSDVATDGFELRVLRYDTGEPVPHARVFALALATREAESGLYAAPLQALAQAKESGIRHDADDDGRFTLSRSERRSLVVVETDELAGFVHLGARSELPAEIFVHEDVALRIRVVDENGSAQPGIDVSLFCSGSDRFAGEIATSTTGGDGTASIAHAGMLRAQLVNAALSARLRAPSDPPIEARVDAGVIARGEAVLVLPASGEVEIFVRHADGTPWLDPIDVGVCVDRLGRGPSALDPSAWTPYPAENGRALVRAVALGVHVHARMVRNAFDATHVCGRGPTKPGERTMLTLTVRESLDDFVLEGRLIDELGAPAERAIVVPVHGTPPTSRGLTPLKLDARGAFRWRPLFAKRASGSVRLFFFTLARNDGAIDRCATSDLASPLAAGTIQLGELVLRTPPPLCSGRVVTSDGRAITGAELSLTTQGATLGIPSPFLRARSDADGRFTIRGMLESPSIFVIARADGFGEATVGLESARTDLTIVLPAAARIRGSIAPSKHFRMDEIVLVCTPKERKAARTHTSRTSPSHERGAFAFTGLGTGVFRVEAFVRPMAGPSRLLAEVRVRPGEDVNDPALQRVDLDSRLHVFELLVRDSSGADVPSFHVSARPAGEAGPRVDAYEPGMHGRIRLVSIASQIDAIVVAEGRRSVQIVCAEGTQTILLSPALTIELVCKDCSVRVPSELALVPSLFPREPDAFLENEDGVAFDARGICRLPISRPGVHEVMLILRRNDTLASQHVELETPPTIDVRDTPELQTFEIALPREALEKALAELRQ